jgi:hypothetical protein
MRPKKETVIIKKDGSVDPTVLNLKRRKLYALTWVANGDVENKLLDLKFFIQNSDDENPFPGIDVQFKDKMTLHFQFKNKLTLKFRFKGKIERNESEKNFGYEVAIHGNPPRDPRRRNPRLRVGR